MRLPARLASAGLGARLAIAFATVAIGTAVAVAVATPPIVGRGFAAMQAEASAGADASPGTASSAGRGLGPRAGQGGGLGPGSGMGTYLSQAQQETTITIIVVAGVAALIASLLGWVIARRVARPLERLEEAAAAVSRGDLGARSGLAERGDEIGSLGRSFDAMAEDLQRSETARKRFFQDAAHEMKTPLAVIDATAAAVMDGVYSHEDRHLDTIRQQTRLLGRVVDDLRTISLAEAGALGLRPEPVAVPPLLDAICSSFAARAEAAGVLLRVANAPDGPPVPLTLIADRDRLAQAIGALVDNAIRYEPTGRTVVLSADGTFAPGGRALVRIAVDDDGPGVAPDDLAHLFERFYQADPARDRTSGTSGLGLAIVRAIVEAQGGAAGAENRPEGGARFWVRLPAANR